MKTKIGLIRAGAAVAVLGSAGSLSPAIAQSNQNPPGYYSGYPTDIMAFPQDDATYPTDSMTFPQDGRRDTSQPPDNAPPGFYQAGDPYGIQPPQGPPPPQNPRQPQRDPN